LENKLVRENSLTLLFSEKLWIANEHRNSRFEENSGKIDVFSVVFEIIEQIRE